MAGLEKMKDGPYTWGDYQSWPDDERWEIIQGEPFAMTPSPTSRHQKVVLKLAISLDRFLASAGQCEVFPAPMDLSTIFDFPVDPEEAMHLVKEGRPGYGPF